MKFRWMPLMLLSLVLIEGSAVAQEPQGEREEMWVTHPNHISVLVADTTEHGDEESQSAFTVGVDYEYRVSRFLGLGAVAERAIDPLSTTTALGVADMHAWRGLAFQTGPGFERLGAREGKETETKFVYRVGALYEVERGRFTVSPQIHLDVAHNSHSLIFAVAFGFGF